MIQAVTGCNNRASLFIPLIRLQKPALASVTTPEGAKRPTRRVPTKDGPGVPDRLSLNGSLVSYPLIAAIGMAAARASA